MNSRWLDDELVDIDKEPPSWPDMLTNMFDGDIDVIEVNDGKEVESLNLFKY